MEKFILGRKIGMTQVFTEESRVVPVTVIEAAGCVVVRILEEKKDGYNAVLLGFGDKKKCNKPQQKFFEKSKIEPKKVLKEFRVDSIETYKIGDAVSADIFKKDEKVNVTGRSIGKGFAGTIKRWNFHRGPMTHGSKNHRLPGSIGGGTSPGKVLKGKKMPGRLGNKNICVKNLEIVFVNSEKNLIYLKGAIPGKRDNIVTIYN
ncbi:50S ribosomal protein L3 [Candidatus Margulisiibacteriota bacterium]